MKNNCHRIIITFVLFFTCFSKLLAWTDTTTIRFTALAQTFEVKYYFGKEKINITNNNDWIIINHFKEQSYYTISVLENENDESRKNRVILKGKNRTRVIDIVQEGQDITLKGLYCRRQISKWTIVENGHGGSLRELILPNNLKQGRGLTILKLDNNKMESLDISRNPHLEELDCHSNYLKNLDLLNNSKLKIVDCGYNYIRHLDFNNNKDLLELSCERQAYQWIRRINEERNLLNYLDLPDQQYNQTGTKLKKLNIEEANLKTPIDIKNLPELESLDYSDNGLSSLDVTHSSNRTELVCYSNNLKTLDLTKNPNLEYLNISWNKIKQIDLSNNLKLKIMTCVGKYKISVEIYT